MSTRPPMMFLVARNPADSSLPYLVRLPLGSGELILKARDSWPRTAKVFCHRAEAWPEALEILEEVPVRSCVRRGVAIDLVLGRGRENRSQFVFTNLSGGREGIFWQSSRTTRKARPSYRMPTGRPAGLDGALHIWVDTREHYPYRFARQQVTTERRALPAGDYGVSFDDEVVAIVERKTVADLGGRLVDGQLAFLLAELSTLPRSALVVEDRYADLLSKPPRATGLPRRPAGRGDRSLPGGGHRLLRHATAGRGMDLSVPGGSPHLSQSAAPGGQ